MMRTLLLAQVAAPLISQDTAISWPVAVAALTVAAIIIESRVKIARLERDVEAANLRAASAEAMGHTNAKDTATVMSLLGELKAGIRQLHEDFRADKRAAG